MDYFSSDVIDMNIVYFQLPLYANRPEMVEKYVTQSLRKLNLRHIDMFLIQAPFGIKENEYHEDGSPVIDYDTNITAIWQVGFMFFFLFTLCSLHEFDY